MADEDLPQAFTEAILNDFAERTDGDFNVILEPLGDGMGWRALIVTPQGLELARASNPTVHGAIDVAVSRTLQRIKEAMEEDSDDTADIDDD